MLKKADNKIHVSAKFQKSVLSKLYIIVRTQRIEGKQCRTRLGSSLCLQNLKKILRPSFIFSIENSDNRGASGQTV